LEFAFPRIENAGAALLARTGMLDVYDHSFFNLSRHSTARSDTPAFTRKETSSVAASASEWTRCIHSLALAATKLYLRGGLRPFPSSV
jgi:hypothetical protein